MRTIRLPLTANQALRLDEVGTFIRLKSATGAVKVRAESKNANTGGYRSLANELELAAGDRLRFNERFDYLLFTDLSGANNALVLIIGEGDHEAESVTGSVSVTNDAASTFDSSADVALADASSHDLAADATVREWIFEADAGNTGDLRIRDQAGTTSEGKKLKPGETVFLSNKGALRIRNNSGAAQNFSIAANKG